MSERPRARTSRELMIDSLKVEVFDALLEKFQNITSKMKHISPGDEEIGQKLLREQAKKVQAQIVAYLKNRTKHGLELTDEMIAFKGLETKLKELHFETVIKPQLPKPPKPEDIAKTKEKYSVRYPVSNKSKLPAPSEGKDYDANWKCAMEIRRLICQGEFGKHIEDVEIFKCYDWAVEHCTVKGKPIEHRNKLINGYDNAKRKTKSDIIIAKFEEDYYE